jgi:hypothetical protein
VIKENKSSCYSEIKTCKEEVFYLHRELKLPTKRRKTTNLKTKIMKKISTFLLLAFTIIGCSSSDNMKNNSVSIIGKWTLDSQFSSDGTNENIDECKQRTIITFKTNNTFDNYNYRTINGDCVLEDESINVEYKIENDVLEIYENGTTNNLAIDIWKRDN